jgi:hypothetical protein
VLEGFPDRHQLDEAINSMQSAITDEFTASEMVCDCAATISNRLGSNKRQVKHEMTELHTSKLFERGQLSAVGVLDYMEQNVFEGLRNYKKTLEVVCSER